MSKIINKLKYERERIIRIFNHLVYLVLRQPKVYDIDYTIDTIINKRASIARFGDGEFDIIFGRRVGFQRPDTSLSAKLKKVLKANGMAATFLVGIPDCYGDLSHFTEEARHHWKIRLDKERLKWYLILNRKKPYYQAQISRFYLDWNDKNKSLVWADKLKQIWEGRNILIVEGQQSRLGMGNDLFDNAKTLRRVLCPSKNAFEQYDAILEMIERHAPIDDLILIALGPTASLLAFDLHNKGYQAIDIGHVDIEYVWMKMGVMVKTRIPGRFMNDLDGGRFVDDDVITQEYLSQIIDTISE